jgi:hypothetical protein
MQAGNMWQWWGTRHGHMVVVAASASKRAGQNHHVAW